jgi:hypothetical protein
MEIIKHDAPKLNMPHFKCDVPLSKHLNEDPILKYMNKTFASSAIIGKKGSGKTSLLISWLQTPYKFKRVFYEIFVWMPKTSRASLKDSIYDKLPEDQLFEGVSFENLKLVYERLKENTTNNNFTLLIFDDVQSYLKDSEVERNLLHLIANARHLRCCIFIVAQNWNKIPKNIRISMNDLFLFNVSKDEYDKIFDEWLEINDKEFKNVLQLYTKYKNEDSHSFIYIHEKTKFFINYNEIVFKD